MEALAVLMLASQAASWVALGVYGTSSVLYIAAFYWLWAVKNIVAGPLKQDLGVITFGLVSDAHRW